MKMTGIAGAMAAVFLLYGGAEAAALSIEDAVSFALQENTALHIKEKGEDTARAELKAARGKNSFSLSASGGFTESRPDSGAHTRTGTASLSASLPLYTGGANEAQIKSGELGLDAARLATERERENLRYNVVKAYYDVLEAQRTVGISQETVDKYQAHLQNVELLYQAGSKARLDVLRSSVELANARQALIKAQNDCEVRFLTLKNLLRLPAEEPLTLTEDFSYRPFYSTMEACVAYAVRNRKDILMDRYTLRQKELALDVACAGYLPQVNLSASAEADRDFQPRSSESHHYSAGVRVSWTVFDGGVTAAAVDKAKTALAVAALTLQQDMDDADQAVRQAYYGMREAEKRLSSTQAAVGEAREDYAITMEKYRVGQGILLDVIDAQIALSTAEMNFASAQYDYARNRAKVENAAGLSLGDSEESIDPAAVEQGRIRQRTQEIVPSSDYQRAKAVVDGGHMAVNGADGNGGAR
ncbi:MAG: TolC family protein [Schwartzia sp. (in: firmicutes)]